MRRFPIPTTEAPPSAASDSRPPAAAVARILRILALLPALALPAPALAQGAMQVSRSQEGIVSSAHPLATEAGVRMLELGGNAADAAVAAGFAIAVVEPSMNSIGGRNQILVRLPDGTLLGIDGTTQAPATYDHDTAPQAEYGYAVVGVPGAAAGLLRLHAEHGSLPLATVMEPAIDFAENGFRLQPLEALRQAFGAGRSREFPGTAAIYLRPDGNNRIPGEMLVQRDYAATLRAIAAGGHDAFYRGEIARRMAEDLQANGSAVTLASLSEYRAEDSRVVRGTYRGYEIVGLDVPSGGVIALQALNLMEHFDPSSMSEAEWAAVKGQALGMAAGELRRMGTDTAAARAISKEWAAGLVGQIRAPAGARRVQVGAAPGGGDTPAGYLPVQPDDQGHTTHLTTADGNGMMVALTQTLGPSMGSYVVTPGLGFLYASTLGGYLGRVEPGERARSNISPMMVLRDGVPVLALGGAGGGRIPPGVVQVISRVIDDGMDLPRALAAPRVYMGGGTLEAETTPGTGWTHEQVAEMRALGLEVRENLGVGSFARVHAVQFDAASNAWIGGADPDWEGSAQGPNRLRRPGGPPR
jgi:gamma-glutamyltranspeptidase / glutathione hydrolase